MSKWTSTVGPRQTKEADKAIRDLRWRGMARVELTDHGSHEITAMCADPSAEAQEAASVIGDRFGWTITRENVRDVIAAFEAATAAIVLPVDDMRTTADERIERDLERKERELKRLADDAVKTSDTSRIADELRAACPWAIPDDGKTSGHARAAKNLRKELTIAFPGVKFSVTSESFSMGNSVDVSWTDGPTSAEVEKFSAKYQDSSFDGMDDSTNYDNSAHGAAVELVLGRAKYCHTSRSYTQTVFETVQRALCEAQNVAYVGQYTRELYGTGDPETVATHASQLVYATSIPVGAVVTGVEEAANDHGRSPYRLTFDLSAVAPAAPTVAAVPATTGARVEKHRHTKKNFDMWLVIPTTRLDRPAFESFRSLCEAVGGWYSRQWGTTPGGFAFKVESDAVGFASTFASAPPVASAEPGESKPVKAAPSGLASKLRGLADAMESTIEDKLREMTQNWTPKRGVEYASRRHTGNNLKAAQHALRLLADAHDAGTCPLILADITTKKMAVELTDTRIDTSGGYYSFVDTGELRDKSPKAVALRQFVESGKSAADVAADEERKRLATTQAKIDDLRGVRIEGFFPTPASVVAEMLSEADIRNGHTVLEPSAGIGSIADAIVEHVATLPSGPGVLVMCCEIRPSLRDILKDKGHALTDADDFLQMAPAGDFDRIVMNPPFERGADCQHVQHAYGMLKSGGRLVALMADSAAFRNGFSTWLDAIGGESRPLPPKSFDSLDAFNRTGVNVRLVVADKPA